MRTDPQTHGPILMRDRTESLARTHLARQDNSTHILRVKYETDLCGFHPTIYPTIYEVILTED